jgi:serine/threonine-protein kinase
MGVVYHGFDPVIGRGVAVKTLHLSEAGTGLSRNELIGRFQTEARAAGLLTHPNIVVVYDAGEEDGLFYITMEFVQGRSLQSLIDAHQPFPVPRVLKLMEQVCSALDFAHQHNVVHRDIKPANLMLTADDVVKITDFGTAKILQFGTAQTAHVMGTPSYMSPEQVKGKPVDGRSDIFSLGVILYELLTGEKPFPGQNITTVIYKIINEEPIPPRSLDSTIHPGLSAVIGRALAKDPSARYQSCHELLTALKNYHELSNPDITKRVTPVAARPAAAAGAALPQPPAPRPAAIPVVPAAPEPGQPIQFMLPVNVEEERSGKPGSLLLTFILLGVIGYAGYRVYPPVLDLWQRAHAPAEAPAVAPKTDAAPAASPSLDNSNSGSVSPQDARPGDSSQPASLPAAAPATPPATALTEKTSPAPAAAVQPEATAPPATASTAPATDSAAPSVPSKPTPAKATLPPPPPGPTAAQVLENRLHAELAGSVLNNKVNTQVTTNALTLSGSLSLAEHRELLSHLRTVPAGVRVIDDTEYADSPTPSAAASASTGSIWVHSEPPGANILVDGTDTGLRTPARVEIQPGQHQIRLVRSGVGQAQRSVIVTQGQTMQFTETLH